MSKQTVYVSCKDNGPKEAERIADMYREGGIYHQKGTTVRVEYGETGKWGSAIPGSDSFGQTEKGYKIIVEKK